MTNEDKKHIGSLKGLVEFYQDLYRDGIIAEGSAGYDRMMQLEKRFREYGRRRVR